MRGSIKAAVFCAVALVPSVGVAATIGEPIPSFKLPELSDTGVMHSPDDYRGKVVLLTVWASWCGVCRAQIPEMVKMQKDLGPKGLVVMAVSIDEDTNAPRACLKKIEGQTGPLNIKVLHDRYQKVARGLGSHGVPNNWIVDREGTVVQVIRGGFDAKSARGFRRMLSNVLAGKPPGEWYEIQGEGADEPRAKGMPRTAIKIDPSRLLMDGGSIDRDAAARALEREALDIRFCYEKELDRKPGLQGDVLVRFVVDEKGHVDKAVIEQSYVNHEALEACIVKAIEKAMFPLPNGGPATIRYPFVFKP